MTWQWNKFAAPCPSSCSILSWKGVPLFFHIRIRIRTSNVDVRTLVPKRFKRFQEYAGIMVGHCHPKFHCLTVCHGLCIWSAETLDGQKLKSLHQLMGCLPRVPWSTCNLHASRIAVSEHIHRIIHFSTVLGNGWLMLSVHLQPPSPFPRESSAPDAKTLELLERDPDWSSFVEKKGEKKTRNWFHASVKFLSSW